MCVYTHTYGAHTYICETEAALLKGEEQQEVEMGRGKGRDGAAVKSNDRDM